MPSTQLGAMRQRAWFWLSVLADLAFSIPAEICREVRQDLGYALRVYRSRRLVTSLALGALALAIGAATGVFSVVNAVLLRSLPFREPQRLVEIWPSPVNGGHGRAAFYQWRKGSSYLDDAAAYSPAELNLNLSSGSIRVRAAQVSANFFTLLGAPPEFGRDFRPEEDGPGTMSVAILGHALWQQVFGGDPRVLGSAIHVNGVPLTVIGVAPPDVEYPAGAAIWIPSAFDIRFIPMLGVSVNFTTGRLKRGLSLAEARSRFHADVAAHGIWPQHPGEILPDLMPLRDKLAGSIRQASLVLLGAVGFVLLIACANVTHLLLTRTTERRRELAMRAALGASRARLLQQLITESLLLTAAAAAAGLAVAFVAARLASSAEPAQLSSQNYTLFDWRVLGFAALAAALTGIFFGVVPASVIGRMHPRPDDVRGGDGRSRAYALRAVLVAMQAVLTVLLLAGAFVMGESFLRLVHTDLGFQTQQVVTLNVSLDGTRYEENGTYNVYYRQALDRLRAIPGVESAGAVEYLPLERNNYKAGTFDLDSGAKAPTAMVLSATPEYFETMGIRITAGRDFAASDRPGSGRVAIVNREFVSALGGPGNVIGRKISSRFFAAKPITIVGVVSSVFMTGASGQNYSQVYFPAAQAPPGFATFAVKVRGKIDPYLAVCRDALRGVDSSVPVFAVEPLARKLDQNLARPRFYATAVLFFAVFSLFLAAIAIYGVATYSVQQRRHEIGVRAAMGASPEGLRLMLLRQGAAPIAVGILAGAAGAPALGHAARLLISVAGPADARTCAAAALVLAATAAAAVWRATRSVLKLDPMTVLRAE